MKNITRLAIGAFIALIVFSGCTRNQGTITISEEELSAELDRLVSQYQAQGADVSEEQVQQMRASLLDQMIEKAILVAAALASGQELDEAALEAEVESVRSQFGDKETYLAAIAQYGYTDESLRQEISDALLIQQYLENVVLSALEISDDEVEAFYNENPSYFETPETVTASHILILLDEDADESQRAEAERKINEVAQLLADGADFAETAMEYSEGPSAPSGGDLGEFQRGQMVAPFEEAAFALEVGEISDVVETQFGLHLIYVRSKTEAGTMDLETVGESIRNYLLEQMEGEAITGEIERLREAYTLEVPEV
jgi:peptidyl-prolyl cis-trans isomerase C